MQREKFKPEKTIKKITKKVIPLKNVEISKNDDWDDSSSIGISKGTSHLEQGDQSAEVLKAGFWYFAELTKCNL